MEVKNFIEDLKNLNQEIIFNGYKYNYEDIGIMVLDLMAKYKFALKCDPNVCKETDNCLIYKESFFDCYKTNKYFCDNILVKGWLIKNEKLFYKQSYLKNILSIKNIISYLIERIIENIYTNKENINEIVDTIIETINIIFSNGTNENRVVYKYKIDDFCLQGLNQKENPLLQDLKEYRAFLFSILIEELCKEGFLASSLKIFRKYSYDYSLSFRTFLVKLRSLNFNELSSEEIVYFLMTIESERKKDENAIFICKNYVIKLIVEAKFDKKEWKYNELIESKTSNEIQEILYFIGPKMKILWDHFMDLSLIKDFKVSNRELSQTCRYYLSIIQREFGRMFESSYKESDIHYDGWINNIKKELDKRYEKFQNKIIEKANTLEKDKKIELINKFFLDGYNNTINNYVKGKTFNNVENINDFINRNINKIANNELLFNQIVGGEVLFESIKYSELECDYTYLVTSQIKSIERYLKEAILKYLGGKKFKKYQDGKESDSFTIPINTHLINLESKKYTDRNKAEQEFVKIELGQIHYFFKNNINSIEYSNIFETNGCYTIFNKDFNNSFIQNVRNGHFHTSIIKNVKEARKIRNETAFWLLCVLKEIKGL